MQQLVEKGQKTSWESNLSMLFGDASIMEDQGYSNKDAHISVSGTGNKSVSSDQIRLRKWCVRACLWRNNSTNQQLRWIKYKDS